MVAVVVVAKPHGRTWVGTSMVEDGPAVRARGLVKHFGERVAVGGLDLEVPRGVCYGLLGPNGAGKTTTIRMIQCVAPRDGGELEVLGHPVDSAARTLRQRMGVVPQVDNLDPDLKVLKNLQVHARYFGIPAQAATVMARAQLAFFGLSDREDSNVEKLSGGLKRRLVLARSLINDPELLVLDEPTTGLDPQARHAIWERIRQLRREGRTILLTTHYMGEAELLCDELVIIDEGRILARGAPRDLITEHTGPEALELVPPGHDSTALITALDALAADLTERDITHERVSDRIIAHPSDGEALRTELAAEHDLAEVILRHATLEDVFLRLTGRALRD